MDNILLFQLFAFLLSGFVHGIFGFGFPMIATPLLSLFSNVKEAVLLTLFPTIVANGQTIKKSGNFKLVWREYKLLIIFVIVGSFLGTNLLIKFNSEHYKLILALVILMYLNKNYMKFSLEETLLNNPQKMLMLFGFLSGFISGLVNVMVPILVIYILEAKIIKDKSVTLMNFCFISSKMTQIVIFGSYGAFSLDFTFLMIPVIVVSLIGLFLGEKIRKYIDENLYIKILKIMLWVLSIYLIIQAFF